MQQSDTCSATQQGQSKPGGRRPRWGQVKRLGRKSPYRVECRLPPAPDPTIIAQGSKTRVLQSVETGESWTFKLPFLTQSPVPTFWKFHLSGGGEGQQLPIELFFPPHFGRQDCPNVKQRPTAPSSRLCYEMSQCTSDSHARSHDGLETARMYARCRSGESSKAVPRTPPPNQKC